MSEPTVQQRQQEEVKTVPENLSHIPRALTSVVHPTQPTENLFISISGLIGAGKTTFARRLAEKLGLPVFYEPVTENPYLAHFYQDMAKYSFPLQIYLLNERFKQHQQIIWSGRGGVQDRTIYEDGIFAKMLYDSHLMSDLDYQTYTSLFSNMSNFMRKPNIIVHLDVSPEVSLARVHERNRDCEKGMTLEYLQNLHAHYEEWIRDVSRVIPVIKVNWSKYQSAEVMADLIKTEVERLQNIRYIDFSTHEL
ncbi:putative Deoxyadenosine kinase [Paratrimastix pyriformis]|uniref:Deoxyadenosine kinase n=1 Tax=Paratrimastix pyriformis TaxID=342808 RepID=A0ABQ8UN59_9EUKA|nr:putative Deoxyadenosine kinase [Paratrimastix pyriformis]|eukprot:GAFH01003071.1.p1 GENE.GAFH01003071.1~~GAFH01003071.1.p1  ORF type:complete len:259 (+),score=38.21 GAFH01003071.1:26-778(+)